MAPLATRPLGTAGQASNGSNAGAGHGGPSTPSGRPVTRRNVPLIALGVLLVVGCALGFSTALLRAGGRQQVLVVTTNLSAGQILTSSDLRTAQLSTSSGLSPIPASDMADVVGRPVALPLAPGTLLTDTDLGPAALPPSGQAVVGLALKAGQYPPDITAGAAVLVVINGSNSSGASTSSSSSPADAPIPATVIGINAPPPDSSDSAVVSVQLAEGNGAAVASAASAGNVALVMVSAGRSR
jgi:SAF domain